MRLLLAAALTAALSAGALAQQGRQPAPARPAAPGAGAPAAQAPAGPAIFPCRTAEEVCFLGIVTAPSQVSILFTNAPGADSIEATPVTVSAGDAGGAPIDMAQNVGRVVMLTGTYDPKAGVTKAQLVEVASPLVSALIKLQAGGEEEEPAPPAPAAKGKPSGGKR